MVVYFFHRFKNIKDLFFVSSTELCLNLRDQVVHRVLTHSRYIKPVKVAHLFIYLFICNFPVVKLATKIPHKCRVSEITIKLLYIIFREGTSIYLDIRAKELRCLVALLHNELICSEEFNFSSSVTPKNLHAGFWKKTSVISQCNTLFTQCNTGKQHKLKMCRVGLHPRLSEALDNEFVVKVTCLYEIQ